MNKSTRKIGSVLLLATLSAAFCGHALAGRPLVVDDANVNEPGAGHVEVFALRGQGSTIYTVAPAYGLIDGLELGAALARDVSQSTTATALQLKWRITKSQENACNFGAVLGALHVQQASNAGYFNGLFSCNSSPLGSLHLNLGTTKTQHQSALGTWGIAYEREFGPLTPHVEWFGAETTKPTVQVGLRGNVSKSFQLDGTIGRSNGRKVVSIGTKFSF